MPKEAKSKEKKVKTEKTKSHFLKDTKAELKKVIWPTPKQLINNTLAVISIVLLTALIVFVLDLCFNKMNQYGVDKLKTIAQGNNTTTSEDTNSTEDNSEETDDADELVTNAETVNEEANNTESTQVNAEQDETNSASAVLENAE